MTVKVHGIRHFSFFHRSGVAAVTMLTCLLCSCIPVTERSVPSIDLPANFSMQGEVPLQVQWWLDFHDDTLSLLVDRAVSNNFSLTIARERIVEAQAIARQAGASLIPSVDGVGSASTTRNHTTNTTRGNYLLGLAASYELDLWGRLRSRRDAALLEVEATEADYQTAALSLGAEVAVTWYQLLETILQLELLAKQKEINSKVLELISVQFRSGQAGIADVLQQRQLVESNIGDIARLQADMQLLKHQLAILLGAVPGSTELPSPSQLPILSQLPDTGIPLDLLASRPDIESSYLKLRAADYRVAAAVADRLPKISISAGFSTSGERSGDLFNNWISSLAANLFGPIIDGGQRKAAVDRTESVARQQFYRHGQTILVAIGEVEDALVRDKGQQIILNSQKNQLKLATETIEHVANRYRQGLEDYQRVLLALLSQHGLERNILSSKLDLLVNRISLYRALSGRIPSFNMVIQSPNTNTRGNEQ